MKRNGNLELRLESAENRCWREKEEQERQETLFYNARVRTCDLTQLQASAIIMLASKEIEEKLKSILESEPSSPSSPLPSSPSYTGLSMKRSLQRFLQKRKSRIQSVGPYNLYTD